MKADGTTLSAFMLTILATYPDADLLVEAPELPGNPQGFLMAGTEWETPWYRKDSGVEGPVTFIVGGTHGYEVAGWMAAGELLGQPPASGSFIIVPRVNMKGVKLRERVVPGSVDLNRSYPGNPHGNPAERLAYELMELVIASGSSLVLDLHESRNFHSIDNSALGQSLIFPSDLDAELAWRGLEIVEEINSGIERQEVRFSLLQGPITGSLTWAVGLKLGIPAFTVETCFLLPVRDRITFQLAISQALSDSINQGSPINSNPIFPVQGRE